ncbi:MarR family transcriptional regulator [Roseibium polysiphoniae]|uniref:MarR family winged helix-turn-helix transcriptional regulator n=1 Tax=Roseibium polysiphoniae TaxID=2571221 RepID=UPI0032981EE9
MTQTMFPFDLDPVPEPKKPQKAKKKAKAKPVETNAPEGTTVPEGQSADTSVATEKAVEVEAQADVSETVTVPEPGDLLLEQFLCFSLYSANHAMTRVYKPHLQELGLTYPQYLAMVVLWQKDKILVGELGDRLQLESNTMTPLLKRLEAMELLTRTRDKKDERQVRIALTRKGRTLKKKTGSLSACILAATGVSVEEVIDLQGKIMLLRDNLLKAAETDQ